MAQTMNGDPSIPLRTMNGSSEYEPIRAGYGNPRGEREIHSDLGKDRCVCRYVCPQQPPELRPGQDG